MFESLTIQVSGWLFAGRAGPTCGGVPHGWGALTPAAGPPAVRLLGGLVGGWVAGLGWVGYTQHCELFSGKTIETG